MNAKPKPEIADAYVRAIQFSARALAKIVGVDLALRALHQTADDIRHRR